MTLAKHEMIVLRSYLEKCGYDLEENYSGRHMYGKTCFGFIVDDDDPLKVFAQLIKYLILSATNADDAEDIDELTANLIDGIKTDTMGKSSHIIYFPEIRWDKEEEEEEEE